MEVFRYSSSFKQCPAVLCQAISPILELGGLLPIVGEYVDLISTCLDLCCIGDLCKDCCCARGNNTYKVAVGGKLLAEADNKSRSFSNLNRFLSAREDTGDCIGALCPVSRTWDLRFTDENNNLQFTIKKRLSCPVSNAFVVHDENDAKMGYIGNSDLSLNECYFGCCFGCSKSDSRPCCSCCSNSDGRPCCSGCCKSDGRPCCSFNCCECICNIICAIPKNICRSLTCVCRCVFSTCRRCVECVCKTLTCCCRCCCVNCEKYCTKFLIPIFDANGKILYFLRVQRCDCSKTLTLVKSEKCESFGLTIQPLGSLCEVLEGPPMLETSRTITTEPASHTESEEQSPGGFCPKLIQGYRLEIPYGASKRDILLMLGAVFYADFIFYHA